MSDIQQLRIALHFFEGQIAEETRNARKWKRREEEARANREKAQAICHQMTQRAQQILDIIYK